MNLLCIYPRLVKLQICMSSKSFLHQGHPIQESTMGLEHRATVLRLLGVVETALLRLKEEKNIRIIVELRPKWLTRFWFGLIHPTKASLKFLVFFEECGHFRTCLYIVLRASGLPPSTTNEMFKTFHICEGYPDIMARCLVV